MPEIKPPFNFADAATRLGTPLSAAQLAQFAQYETLLVTWNVRINLTAVDTPIAIQQRHFLDSLTCAAVMQPGDGRSFRDCALIDVGSGAGFPGLPLKILWPALKVTLVESVAKKARFLELVVAELGLSDVDVVVERAEALGQRASYRAQYDWATARAVAPLPVLVEYLLPLCRVGGWVVAQKGVQAPQEVGEATTAVHLLGGGAIQLHPTPPLAEEPGYLVVIPKERETPARYPRRVGIPGKRPLR